jgi:hypothetical protein
MFGVNIYISGSLQSFNLYLGGPIKEAIPQNNLERGQHHLTNLYEYTLHPTIN